jgi:hypothetical protein
MARPRFLPALLAIAVLVVGVGVSRLTAAPARSVAAPTTTSSTSTSSTSTTSTTVATALNPGLVAAFARAQADAQAAGRHLTINSGFRTAAEQQRLLDEEIRKRGSIQAALRWVFTPEKSMHVKGLAVDVGNGPAADWLQDVGARYGLCRTLQWEWWHFEWRARWAQAQQCPRPVDDPDDAPTA